MQLECKDGSGGAPAKTMELSMVPAEDFQQVFATLKKRGANVNGCRDGEGEGDQDATQGKGQPKAGTDDEDEDEDEEDSDEDDSDDEDDEDFAPGDDEVRTKQYP